MDPNYYPNQAANQYDRKSIAMLVVLSIMVIGGILWWMFADTSKGKLTITSDPAAEISVTTERGGDFEVIGTGTATYQAEADEEEVYIQAKLGEQVAVTSRVIDFEENQEVELLPKNTLATTNPKKMFSGTVRYPYIEGNEAFGLSPTSGNFVSFGTKSFKPTRPGLAALNAAQKVIWENSRRFVYDTVSVGVVIYGEEELGEVDIPEDFFDVSRYKKKPYVFLGLKGLSASNKLDWNTRKINQFDASNGIYSLYTSPSTIYVVREPYPGEYVEDEGDAFITPVSVVSKFGYDGSEQGSVDAEIVYIENVVPTQEGELVFGRTSTYLTSSQTRLPTYFSDQQTTVLGENGKIYALNEVGLWLVDDVTGSYHLVQRFDDDLEGQQHSLQARADGLLYGVTAAPDSTNSDKTATYLLKY